MPLDLVQTLCELVAIPSVNPMGRPVSGPEFYEYRMTDCLEKLFARLGLPSQRQSIEPMRENIVARLDGAVSPAAGGRVVMLEAHQDTVPVDGMTIPPWTPQVKDGRVYGRGACDIKGGMAAMLGAISRLAEERPPSMPTVIMACSVNEEHGYSGASDLERLWAPGANVVIPRRPDACIVAEPTNLHVVIAHKGACRWRCHTRGKAAHSSQPHLGHNAIYAMSRVVSALEEYARDVRGLVPAHRLCGEASLSVGMIRGGLSVNTVPDQCTIEIDRRVLPGEDGLAAQRQVIDYVASRLPAGFPIEHEVPYIKGTPLNDDANGVLAAGLSRVASELYGKGDRIGVPYGTDAAKTALQGVPSVVFGPGSIDQAHTADEWLAIDELEKASEVLYRFLRQGGV